MGLAHRSLVTVHVRGARVASCWTPAALRMAKKVRARNSKGLPGCLVHGLMFTSDFWTVATWKIGE